MVKTVTKLVLLFALSSLPFALSSEAKVIGDCSNCHTMHNSQGGRPMNFNENATPNKVLLRGNCIGCHGQNPSGTQNIMPLGNIPQVLLSASANPLAGGNFKYLDTDDNRGHNVIDTGNSEDNTNMFPPPGEQHSSGILETNFTCLGKYGCHGDRTKGLTPDTIVEAMKGAHHTDDAVIDGSTVGKSYRFLKGITGVELNAIYYKWEQTADSTHHNGYKGGATPATDTDTISYFCGECHENFHGHTNLGGSTEVGSSSPWFRHPTDLAFSNVRGGYDTSEYASYTIYSTTVPVALVPPSTSTSTVDRTSMVMCLSCHRAHASPYFKMMRWDYKSWPGAGSGGCDPETGKHGCCNVCHTSKD